MPVIVSGEQAPAEYFLSRWAHVCILDDHAVLLDLRQDRYLALDNGQTRGLHGLVHGWPLLTIPDEKDSRSPTLTDTAVRRLLDQGLLTRDTRLGKPATPLTVEPPTVPLLETALLHRLVDSDVPACFQITLVRLARFLRACAFAVIALRVFSLEQLIHRTEERKQKHRASSRPCDITAARTLVGVFRRLRPFAFTARDACVLDCLALLEFLASYGMFPEWVFGVRRDPFRAHCWVQCGGVVFNDMPEHVRAFTPILSV